MPLSIPPGYANWIVTITNSGGGASSRSSVAMGLELTGSLDQTAVNRVSNLFRDSWKQCYDSGWTVGPCHVLEGQSGDDRVWDDATIEAGTSSATVYSPPATSWIVSKQTGFSGRSNRGRMYMPGVPEAKVEETGILDSTFVSDYTTLMNTLLSALVADAAIDALSLFHSVGAPDALLPTTITNLLVRGTIGTMRPRQRR